MSDNRDMLQAMFTFYMRRLGSVSSLSGRGALNWSCLCETLPSCRDPLALALFLSGCIVTSTAGLLFNGAKLAGKTVYYTGKGVYQVGKLTVRAADGVLDGTERMLRLTILTADATGAVVPHHARNSLDSALEAELAALERTEGVIEVIVEPLD